MDFSAIIAEELKLEVWRVAKALELMDQGGTVPFIARYRKDQTGTLNEIELRDISHRRDYLQELADRKETVLKSIEEQGKLTEELAKKAKEESSECCGQHEVCEKDSLLAAISKQIEYYNDEELDRFRERKGNEYSTEETEEFRDVLYTMRSEEVAGWVRSLQLRQVNLPDEIKDEVFLIIGERRH